MFGCGLIVLTIESSLRICLFTVSLLFSMGMVFFDRTVDEGTWSTFCTVPEFPSPSFPSWTRSSSLNSVGSEFFEMGCLCLWLCVESESDGSL